MGYTQDSGRSFSKIYVTPDKVNFNGYQPDILLGFWIKGVHAVSDATILLYGSYGLASAILLSTDKGSTFKLIYYYDQIFLPGNSGIIKMQFPSGGSIGFAIEFNSVLKSTNGGLSWSRIQTNPNASYSDISFMNLTEGYLINDGLLQKTTDGGITWTTIQVPGGNIRRDM